MRRWFDIDWDSRDNPGKVLVPVLGSSLAECLEAGEIVVEGDRLRYYDHVFPLAAGHRPARTSRAPGQAALPAVPLERRRRRTQLPPVLRRDHPGGAAGRGSRRSSRRPISASSPRSPTARSHGLRVDHPDGLADPKGYLARLSEAARGSWVVVEKILEHGERLPTDWACEGTTGYDALNRLVGAVHRPRRGGAADPAGDELADRSRRPLVHRRHRSQAPGARHRAVRRAEPADRAVVAAAWSARNTAISPAGGCTPGWPSCWHSSTSTAPTCVRARPWPPRRSEVIDRAAERAAAHFRSARAEIRAVAELVFDGPAELVVRFRADLRARPWPRASRTPPSTATAGCWP